jgi:NTP pyrophosphatase (non-canonical NTP hydrolase)
MPFPATGLTEKQLTVCEAAVTKYGARKQSDMVLEELAELTQAILHDRRGRAKPEELCSEIADVVIMLAQLTIIARRAVTPGMLDAEIERKIARLSARLSGEHEPPVIADVTESLPLKFTTKRKR